MTTVLRRRTAAICVILTVLVALTTPVPAQAGIFDSIKGFFGKIFGGGHGSNSNGGATDFASLLSQVQSSQQAVATKQQALASIYNGPTSGINPSDPKLQSQLNDLKTATDANEQAYLALLQARASAQQSGTDLSQYASQIQQLTQVQNQLETNYQKIQQSNQSAGMFKPNASGAAASATAAGSANGSAKDPWNDPKGQQYINEWLASAHLNSWGQFVMPPAITAAGPPDHGSETSSEWVWKNLQDDAAHTSMTLGDYVRSRMAGQTPQLSYSAPADLPGTVVAAPPADTSGGQVAPPTTTDLSMGSQTRPSGVQASGVSGANGPTAPVAAGSSAAEGAASQLVTIQSQIDSVRQKLTDLLKSGQGTSSDAKALQNQLSTLLTQKSSLMTTISNDH